MFYSQTCHQQVRNGYLPTDTQENQDSIHMWYRIDEAIISLQQYKVGWELINSQFIKLFAVYGYIQIFFF